MTRWSDYTTGERIKILRAEMTQEQLAEATELSVATIRKVERDLGVGLPSLLSISAALHTDVSVVLGQQEPRRAMRRDDRAMLRELSRAVHDTAAGVGGDLEPVSVGEVRAGLVAAWDRYRAGQYATAGALVAIAVRQAAAVAHTMPAGREGAAASVMADAFRLASYVANQFGARDLAYAGIGHAAAQADLAGDEMRSAMVSSGRSWIYLRDARLDQASVTAERSYLMIEPRYSDNDPKLLATYGWHVTFAAVVAARRGGRGAGRRSALPGARGRGENRPGRVNQRHSVRPGDRTRPSRRPPGVDRTARRGPGNLRCDGRHLRPHPRRP